MEGLFVYSNFELHPTGQEEWKIRAIPWPCFLLLFFNSFTARTVSSKSRPWRMRTLSVCVCCRSQNYTILWYLCRSIITSGESEQWLSAHQPAVGLDTGSPRCESLVLQSTPTARVTQNLYQQLWGIPVALVQILHSLFDLKSPDLRAQCHWGCFYNQMMMSRWRRVNVDHGCARWKHNFWLEWF